MIEIASGEYDVDLSKLMATAVKKYYEERDTYYLNTINRHDYICGDTGMQYIAGCLIDQSTRFKLFKYPPYIGVCRKI